MLQELETMDVPVLHHGIATRSGDIAWPYFTLHAVAIRLHDFLQQAIQKGRDEE